MTVQVIKATEPLTKIENSYTLFLGGSIEMGAAENWQDRLTKDLQDSNLTILNPRRDDWDSSWVQDPTPGTQFETQVSWELEAQEIATICAYYFADGTKSPITLLELGLFVDNIPVVHCTPKFWRYGNVKVTCDRYGIPVYETYEEFLNAIREELVE